ncbi:hypothetical protein [Frateuria defendens]|uniref:hypothetical protein n=1 Tax=Frateuria defendens TaxID=2219559 RepID=UPI00066FD753|nr:hypothetical protein [Frateuria defendens]
MPNQTWNYAYSPPNENAIENCSNGCVSTVWTDAIDPEGHAKRYTFSNRFDATEGLLLSTDFYAGAAGSALIRSEQSNYANPTGGPWPTSLGSSLQLYMNEALLRTLSPQSQRVLQQDGDTYTWQAEAFNEYAQVTQTRRFNSIAGQGTLQEQTSYLNDTAHWVLGLPQQVTNLGTGEVVDQNVYDLGSVTLKERWHFGQKLMSYAYDGQGNLASFTDGNGHTTSLGNYKRGIPQAIGYPDGTGQSLVVDDFGQITAITDQAGSTTGYSYDPVGRLTQISYPGGDEQAWLGKGFAYDFVTGAERGIGGNHWRRTIWKGDWRQVTYFDALLRPVLSDTYSVADGNSHTNARTDYDWKGQKAFVSYPAGGSPNLDDLGSGTSSRYDALGRLVQTQQTSEQGPLATTTAYLSGARQQVTDPKGQVTTTSYQVFDQPAYEAVTLVQAPEGVTQAITRDLYGNPTAIHQWGSSAGGSGDVTKTLTYDGYHRLCRTTEPESGSEVTAYDGANNVAWTAAGLAISGGGCGQEQVPATAQTQRTYDAMNRVLNLTPPAGTQSTAYTYDALGNVRAAVSGLTTWSATRNKLGQLTRETLQVNGQNPWTIGYAHDAYGSLRQLTYPDGESVAYAPDALGRATQVGGYANTLRYFPNGDVQSFLYGNGAGYTAEQNARQLLSNFTYGRGGTLDLSEDYRYDANGNITQISDLTGGPRTKTFGYDALNRLASAQASSLWGSESYSYDPLNNIRARVGNGQTFTYNYDALNRLGSITSNGSTTSSFAYDNRGNVTVKNGIGLDFDQKNQLTGLPGHVGYAYDAAGRRVMKTPQGGAPTYYFYTQAGQLLYQWDTGTAKTTNYVYLGRKLIARNENLRLIAPSGISFSANPNDGNYTVSWPAVTGATGYTLQESVNGGGWNTVYTGSDPSVAMIGKGGGSYTYQVQACAGGTCTGWTGSASLGVTPVLPTVTVPGGTINGTYTVSWSAPASATAYDVQERLNGGAWATIASNTAATSISRPGTSSGSYTYQVSAKNGYGTRGWAGSNAVTVDTTYGVVPTAPASLSVPASSNDGNAGLSWSASALTTRYVVEQSSNGGISWSGVYNSDGTSTALTGLADGSYVYHVQACNTYGCSPWTAGNATLVVTHPPGSAPAVSTPGNNGNGSYTVSWNGIGGATSYTLQEQLNGGGWTTVQASGATSWNTGGRGNGTYGYRVQACNVGGCGPWSGTASTTVLLPPPTPGSISVPASSNGPIGISWAASPTATRYDLYQSINGGGWTQVYSGPSTSTTVNATTSGNYTFFVAAVNDSGWSGQFANSGTVVVTIPPNAAPSLSVPGSSNSGSYTVSWSGVSEATSYTLLEQLNGGGWSTVQASGATSWGASGKGNGTYGYQVQACNAGGCGPWSGVGSIAVALVPAVPTNAKVVEYFPSPKTEANRAQWDAVSGATRYEAIRNDTGASVYNGTGTSFIMGTAFIPATPLYYNFSVRACNAVGCSGWAVGH